MLVAAAALAVTALVAPAGSGRALAAPAVTGVSPSSGTVCGGTSVTITGTNFTGATAVDFGTVGQPAQSFTVDSDTQITAVSPPGTSIVDVRVTTGGGTSAIVFADSFTYTGNATAPCVTGVSPSSGPGAGGSSVTISGTDFTGATAVDFGSTAALPYTVVSSTEITATAPAGTGTVDITVTNGSGTSPTGSADRFAYAPTVSSVSPNGGPTAGGTSVTISGTGFTGANALDFGATAATSFAVDSDTQITAVSPAGSAGTVDVTVTASGLTSATGNGDLYTFTTQATPTLNVVQPTSGPTAGGTSVRLTGVAFTGATAVHFGAAAAASFSVDTDTQITAVSPAGAAGTVTVTVTGPGGTSRVQPLDYFSYEAPAPAPTPSPPPPPPPPPPPVAPQVTLQPVDATVHAGASVSFIAAAGGTPAPTVQWQVSTDGGASFGDLPGAASSTLSFAAESTDDGNRYRAVFSNSAGSATTNPALLSVISPPDLALTMIYSGPLAPGAIGTYELDVRNVGAGPTTGPIAVEDAIPAGELLRSGGGSGWSCTLQLECAASGSLRAGASLPPLRIVVELPRTRGLRLTNAAGVDTPGDADLANNKATSTLTVGGPEITVSEDLTVADSALVSPPARVTVSDGVAVTDDPLVSPPASLTVSDGVAISDSLQVSPPTSLAISDGVGISDSPQVSPPASLAVSDGVGIGDSPQVSPPASLPVSDGVRITDSPVLPGFPAPR